MEENKEMLELLRKIEKNSRTQVRTGILVCLFALVAAVSCVAVLVSVSRILPRLEEFLPQLEQILPQINTVLTQLQTVLGNLEETTAQLAEVDLQSMVTNVDALVTTGQKSLEQTMEKLNSVDFETLNQAIADLAKVIEPLAKIANLLK